MFHEDDCGTISAADYYRWTKVQYWSEGVLFSFVGAIGLVGNLISIAILLTKEMRKHSFNQMLIGLAMFDLCFIVCGVPVHITPIFSLENRLYLLLYAYFLYPFTAVALTGSIYMTMAITIERFMAVCHPHYYRDVNTRITPLKRVLMYAIPVTTFAVTVNFPKFLETQVHYDNEGQVQYNVTELRLNPTYIWWYTLSYVCHPLLTTTVGPFFVLTVLNYRIYKGIKKARTNVSSSNRHGEMNLARVLVTICVVFLLCNSLRLFLGLQAIINVNITITCVSKHKAWIPPVWMLIMESVSHLLLLISSSTNFLIYCTISTKFKIYIKRKFCWRSSPLVDVPEVNSRIALRTIQKSSNDENDGICNGEAGHSRSGDGGSVPDQNSINTGTHNTAFTRAPSILNMRDSEDSGNIIKSPSNQDLAIKISFSDESVKATKLDEVTKFPNENNNKFTESSIGTSTVVAAKTPPLGGDERSGQRCVSRGSTMTGSTNTSQCSQKLAKKEDFDIKPNFEDEEETLENDSESEFDGYEEQESRL